MKNDALQHGEYRHRDAARDPAFDAGGVRIDFERQNGAIAQLSDSQIVDADFCGNDDSDGRRDANRLAMLDRKHLAKPSDGAGDRKHEADHADCDGW